MSLGKLSPCGNQCERARSTLSLTRLTARSPKTLGINKPKEAGRVRPQSNLSSQIYTVDTGTQVAAFQVKDH